MFLNWPQCSFWNKNYLFSISLKHLLPHNLCVHLISGVCVSELAVVPCSDSHCVRKLCLHKLTLYWCLQLLRTSTSKDLPQSCCQTQAQIRACDFTLLALSHACTHKLYIHILCKFCSRNAIFEHSLCLKSFMLKHSVLQSGYFSPDILTSTT